MSGLWDIHCHFVPGVDDGCKDLKESMGCIDIDYKDGVRNIIVTPHYRKGMFEAPDEAVVHGFERLKAECKKKYKDLELYLGCEVHKHSEILDLLSEDSAWKKTMAGSDWVLLEFKEDDPLDRINKFSELLLRGGYKPILAHIERYDALTGREDVLEKLRKQGAKLQVNADSITGHDGFFVKRKVKKWIKRGLISYVGSDGHNTDDRRPHVGDAAKKIEKWVGTDRMEHIMVRNPARIVIRKGPEDEPDFV